MLLTCPQCETKFEAPDELFVPKGKTVRCSICKHSWFQEPEKTAPKDNSPIENDNKAAQKPLSEEIPKSLKKGPDHSEVVMPKVRKTIAKSTVTGIIGACLFFLLLFGMLILLRSPITSFIPAASGFYNLLGMKPQSVASSITLHNIKGKIEGDMIIVEGEISNLDTKPAKVPMILIEKIGSGDQVIQTWLVEPPVKKLDGGASEALHIEHQNEGDGGVSLKISLTSKTKIQEKPKDNHADSKPTTPEHAPAQEDHHTAPAH
jgi:predicted Zn finger-like uncharacterized protein